ncbi:MAG: variant-type mycofactocin precursor [Desulfobacterales bacterium]
MMQMKEKDTQEIMTPGKDTEDAQEQTWTSPILEEITIEELAIDGICGIY